VRGAWPLALAAALAAQGCIKREELPPLVEPIVGDGKVFDLALPEFAGGKLHSLSSDRGSVVLLDVWATWCEPCRDALPLYEQLVKEYGARGLRAYAVNVDVDQREIPKFVEETKLSLPILLDQNAALSEEKLKVRMMPTTFLLDRRGVIRFVHEGFAEEFLAKYQGEIEQLLAEPAP
jgi:thiol-disulfide isomerase/thioredoxin